MAQSLVHFYVCCLMYNAGWAFRFATMQSAATAAPAHRLPPVTDLTTPTPAAPPDHPQDPALVSQLQARFDALALEEEQGQEKPVQSRQNSGDEGGWFGRAPDHQSSLLVLDGELQTMPWESLPSFKHLRCMIRLITSVACHCDLSLVTSCMCWNNLSELCLHWAPSTAPAHVSHAVMYSRYSSCHVLMPLILSCTHATHLSCTY